MVVHSINPSTQKAEVFLWEFGFTELGLGHSRLHKETLSWKTKNKIKIKPDYYLFLVEYKEYYFFKYYNKKHSNLNFFKKKKSLYIGSTAWSTQRAARSRPAGAV